MVYKYANNILPYYLLDLFTTNRDVHNYTKRQKHLLHFNKSNINIYSKSFGNTSARIWNDMQAEFEVNVSISKFKISFKMYLQEHSLQFKYTKCEYSIMHNVFLFYHIVLLLFVYHYTAFPYTILFC